MKIAIDVDLTTLQSDIAWYEWLQCMCGGPNQFKPFPIFKEQTIRDFGEIDYNLTKYFPPPINKNVNVFDFWRNTGVYDLIKPVDGAVKNISRLMDDGHKVIFVTHNKGHGGRSKFNNIQRLFPDYDYSFVVTSEKDVVDCEVLIDDRNNFLNLMINSGKIGVKLKTPYSQEGELLAKIPEFEHWDEIYDFLTTERGK